MVMVALLSERDAASSRSCAECAGESRIQARAMRHSRSVAPPYGHARSDVGRRRSWCDAAGIRAGPPRSSYPFVVNGQPRQEILILWERANPSLSREEGTVALMSSRRSRLFTVVLLGLLIAAPLSSGDKGLWLSIASTPIPLLEAPIRQLPAEHSTLLPDRSGLALAPARVDRTESAKSVALLHIVGAANLRPGWAQADPIRSCGALEPICSTSVAPRGPPSRL